MRVGQVGWMMAVLLAGCGAATDGRYVGRMVGDAPAPCPDGRAVLLLRGAEARFIPDDGVAVLDGTLSPDGAIAAAAQRDGARDTAGRNDTAKGGAAKGGAARTPFRMVFQGRLDGTTVTGVYGTPRCRGHVELAPG